MHTNIDTIITFSTNFFFFLMKGAMQWLVGTSEKVDMAGN